MSAPHERAAVHSLPSFAQAFSALSSDHRDDFEFDGDLRALPPLQIHAHHSSTPQRRDGTRTPQQPKPAPDVAAKSQAQSRKRARPAERDDGCDSSNPSSPRTVKQEQDVDQLDPSPSPPPPLPPPTKSSRSNKQPSYSSNSNSASTSTGANTSSGAAPPPSLMRPNPPSKRRRVTISGSLHPHPLNTANLPPPDPAAYTPPPYPSHSSGTAGVGKAHTGPSTPISPVVMGFTIQHPQAVEQVRAMLAVKQKQKALIEQRRGSVTGLAPSQVDVYGRRGSAAGLHDAASRRGSITNPAPAVNIVNPTPTSATGPSPPALKRSGSNGAHSLSPSARASSLTASGNTSIGGNGSARTRSPSLLGGARVVSPIPHNGGGQGQGGSNQSARTPPRPYPQPPQTTASALPGRSPPSQRQHAHGGPSPSLGQSQSQSQSSSRPQMVSPPQVSASASGTGSGGGNNTNPNVSASATQLVASQGLSAMAHNLPPPPTSFAHRRAGQLGMRGNKPADIMISPRESELNTAAPSESSSKSQTTQQTPLNQHAQTHAQQQRQQLHFRTPGLSSSYKLLPPSIQSAPPRPGQAPGRFPSTAVSAMGTGAAMALPSLPPVLSQTQGRNAAATRRAPGQVPPTPTRFSIQRAQGGGAESASVRLSQPTGASLRVPRTASAAMFAIPHSNVGGGIGGETSGTAGNKGVGAAGGSGALMPATPATLHRAARTDADKLAFLAPFEQFYDALGDAQVLKGWFGEQLRRVGSLARDAEVQLTRLKEKGKERDDAASAGPAVTKAEVERMVAEAVRAEAESWRNEVVHLRTRIAELEDALHGQGRSQGQIQTQIRGQGAAKGSPSLVNGLPTPMPTGSSQSQMATPPSSSNATNQSSSAYPAAPGTDAYTFPPVQPPPSTYAGFANTISMHPPPPSAPSAPTPAAVHSTTAAAPDPRIHLRRSISPLRSVSQSTTGSPAPSAEFGIARRLSVSAMRFEPPRARTPVEAPTPAPAPPPEERSDVKGKGRSRRGEKEVDRDRDGDKAIPVEKERSAPGRQNTRNQSSESAAKRADTNASESTTQTSAPAPMDTDDS